MRKCLCAVAVAGLMIGLLVPAKAFTYRQCTVTIYYSQPYTHVVGEYSSCPGGVRFGSRTRYHRTLTLSTRPVGGAGGGQPSDAGLCETWGWWSPECAFCKRGAADSGWC
jgi:hypothetical protein